MTILVPNSAKYNLLNILKSDIHSTCNAYYFFLGDTTDTIDPGVMYDYPTEVITDCYHNMIFGQRISANNVAPMIVNIPYVLNTPYAIYDDKDTFLTQKNFYAIVNETAYYHVYKCLDNNFGSNSVAQPVFSDISGANTNFYRTSDGYLWKYMYSVTSADALRFGTTDYFPVIANTSVANNAIPGSISYINVDIPGQGYGNYLYDTFSSGDLTINGNTQVYNLSNSTASSINSFYTGCLIYISGGAGIGQYRTVVDYFTSTSGKYIVLDTSFSTPPKSGSSFQITPKINIYGSGDQSVNAVARGLVNAYSSNSIYRAEIIQGGQGYTFISANVSASPVVSVISQAVVTPIYSPPKGHGADAGQELYSSHLCLSTLFNSNTLTVNTNSFSQIGILKNPIFNNAILSLSNSTGLFATNEQVYKMNPVKICSTANVSISNTTVTDTNADFQNQLSVGQAVYLSSNTSNQLAYVNSIVNSSTISLQTGAYFTSNTAKLYIANTSSKGTVVTSGNSTTITIANTTFGMNTGDLIVGSQTGSLAYINTISIGGIYKNFDSFVGLYKYVCTPVSGTFVNNELVFVGNTSSSNAIMSLAVSNGANLTIFTANQIGSFMINQTIVGSVSGASAIINTKYIPEIVYGSGDIIYLEDMSSVINSANGTNLFKTIFEF